MKSIRAVWDRFETVMFELPVHHPLQLGAYRVIFASWFLISNQVPSTRWVAGIPADFRNPPPGLTGLVPHPSPTVAFALDLALVAALVALLIGFRTRAMSISVGLLGLTSSAMVFSFGKIDHTIFLWIIPLVMSASGWGARLSIDSRVRPSEEGEHPVPAIPFLSILLALAFLTAGLPKLSGGWLSTASLATKSYFLDKVVRGETNISTPFVEGLDSNLVWELADWSTIILEFGFAALVLFPLGYRVLLLVTILFHISVLFVLNINFESLLILYLVFAISLFNVDRLKSLERTLFENKAALYGGGAAIVIAVAAQLGGPGLLRTGLAVFGVGDWGATLLTQTVFLVVFYKLVMRSFDLRAASRRSRNSVRWNGSAVRWNGRATTTGGSLNSG